jgi:putative MATE family efflux protein
VTEHTDTTLETPPGSTEEHADIPGFWTAVWMAIKGTGVDYTKAPMRLAIVLLAVPMVLEMVMESVFAVVDIFFVSRLGPEQVATVGLTESMMTLVYTVAMGLSIGVTAMIARRAGEKDQDAAGHTAAQAVLLGGALAIVLGVVGWFSAPWLLGVMGAAPEVVEIGSGYTRIMLAGNITVLLLFMNNAAFRGVGDAVVAMRMLWLANGINIVLDPTLIFGWGPFPEMGVQGAAVATVIGRGTAVSLQMIVLIRGMGRLNVQPRHWRLDLPLMWKLMRLSATATLQTFIGMASWIGLVRIIAIFGSGALAGYTIAIRIVMFALLPAWGMSNAAATMVGQALGAEKPDRAEKSVWIACYLNLAFLGSIGVLFMVFAGPIVRVFSTDPETVTNGILALRTVSAGFFFYAYGMVLINSFNGAGDTWTPTWVNFLCFWVFQIPLAWVLARTFEIGPWGVHIAVMLGFSAEAVVAGLLFRRGKWKEQKV